MSTSSTAALTQLAHAGRQLYRSILRLHRERLPGQMRELGDSYVRAEFGSHLRSKSITVQQAQEFLTQWRGYLAMLSGPAAEGAPPGGASTTHAHAALQTPASPAAGDSGGHEVAAAVDSVRQMSEGLHVYMTPEQRLRMEALKKEAGQLGVAMLQQQPDGSSGAGGGGKRG